MPAYKNGNTLVLINGNDGTRILHTNDDEFNLAFPCNMDVTITERCDGNCGYCYMGCTPEGKHAELLDVPWIDSLHSYTELAINGNDISHPQLRPFLEKLRDKHIFTNLTVNQIHFMKHYDYIKELYDEHLIHGIGVSYVAYNEDFIKKVKSIPTVVIHTINGILTREDVDNLSDKDLKILVLGYKTTNRGGDYIESNWQEVRKNQSDLFEVLPNLKDKFKVISFDNLALEQLDVKRIVTEKEWEQYYQGDDGTSTMFIDMVNNRFSINSTCTVYHKILDNVEDMFAIVKECKRKGEMA